MDTRRVDERLSNPRPRSIVRRAWLVGIAVAVASLAVAAPPVATAGSAVTVLGPTGANVANGVGGSSVLDQASGLVPSRYDRSAFLVVNQYNIQRFVPGANRTANPLTSTIVYRGGYSQLEAIARGRAPVTNRADRIMAFQATEWGERSKVVVFVESRTTGVVTREAEYPLKTASGNDLPNVEAVLYEPDTRRAWFFTKNDFPTRIFHIDFSAKPVNGAFRADAWVGTWSWQARVPVRGTNCRQFETSQLAPTDVAVDPTDPQSVLIVSTQRYRQPTAAAMVAYRRPAGADWRTIDAHPEWRTDSVQFGTGSDPCFPYDVGGLGIEAVGFPTYTPPAAGASKRIRIWMIQDNAKANRVGSRQITVQGR